MRVKGKQEAEILAKTLRDHLTAYRKQKVMDTETLQTLEKEILVYENIPCALSKGGNNRPDRQEFHSEKQFEAVIFAAPEIELLDHDRIVITTETGQVFDGITGKTFKYVSHSETPFAVESAT